MVPFTIQVSQNVIRPCPCRSASVLVLSFSFFGPGPIDFSPWILILKVKSGFKTDNLGTSFHGRMIFRWNVRRNIATSLVGQINFPTFHMLNALMENGSHDGLWSNASQQERFKSKTFLKSRIMNRGGHLVDEFRSKVGLKSVKMSVKNSNQKRLSKIIVENQFLNPPEFVFDHRTSRICHFEPKSETF